MSNYSDAINLFNPVAYWRLGESAGTDIIDETLNYDGVYVGSPTLGITGLLVNDSDTAVSTSGSSDYLNLTNFLSTLKTHIEGTFVASIKLPVGGVFELSSTDLSSTGNMIIQVIESSGTILLEIRDSSNVTIVRVDYLNRVLANTIYNLIFVQDDAAGVILYLDGIELIPDATSGTLTGAWLGENANNVNLHISFLDRATNYYRATTVDEVAFYSTILTQANVTYLQAASQGAIIFNKVTELISTKNSAQSVLAVQNINTSEMIAKTSIFIVEQLFIKSLNEFITQQSNIVVKADSSISTNLMTTKNPDFIVTSFINKLTDTIIAHNFVYGYKVSMNIASAYFSTYNATFTKISKFNTGADNIIGINNTVSVVTNNTLSTNEIISNSFTSAIVSSINTNQTPFIGINFSQISPTSFNISSNQMSGKNVSVLMLSNINKATITTITYPASFTQTAIQKLVSDLIKGLDFITSKSGQREIVGITCFINRNTSTVHFINQSVLENLQLAQSFNKDLNISSIFENDSAIITTVEIDVEL